MSTSVPPTSDLSASDPSASDSSASMPAGALPAGALPADYYLANFHTLVSFVEHNYGGLLSAEETGWLRAFRDCDEPAQRLYVRLLGRRGPMFRLGRLAYREIADIAAAAAELVHRGLADDAPPPTPATLVEAFTKPELIALLEPGAPRSLARPALVERLLERAGEGGVRERLAASDGWLSLRGHAHFGLFSLCFFGNLHQDTSEFVLRDLGAVRYERYPSGTASRAFDTRAQIEAHLAFFDCERRLERLARDDAAAHLALMDALPRRRDDDPVLCRRLDRLRNRVARRLERLGQGEAALVVYAGSMRPPARERRVRLLLAAGRLAEAEALCEAMAHTPVGESESQFVERARARLARASGRRAVPVRAFRPLSTRLVLHRVEGRVECVVRDFYARSGACHYVENALVTGMLGLFAWDIVFLPLPGAFFHPFQTGPSDFRDARFRAARRAPFEARLAELERPERVRARVLDVWRSRHGVANPLVRWGRLSEPLLELALERVPSAHWRALFERVLADTRENTAGLPDLVRFPDTGGYELIEVKGPGDALQPNQRRWMRHFAAHRIPYRVVNVRWASAAAGPAAAGP